ncbi:MAG TPA: hypothetical protein VLB47_10785, partial [Solirubrobacteraceae bacterium]|nr:hypothetical protein [Solirubrobacteraceae bacterium]
MHDDLGDGDVELGAQVVEDPGLDPVAALGRVGGHDHLLRAEQPQLVADRGQRVVRVADDAERREPLAAGPRQRLLEPPARVLALAVDVGDEEVAARQQDRCDDAQLGPRLPVGQQALAQRLAAERLV